ncbi:MAG: SDR family NAD(P)-dependent oxidoreductase [Gaiellaceae bacterium]
MVWTIPASTSLHIKPLAVAVVTGASSGIGAELVRQLQARGTKVVGLSRRPSTADEHELCDVSDRQSVRDAADRVLGRHPSIDLLVNNAGVAARGNYLDADPDRIEQVMQTNYFGSVWTTLAFLSGLAAGSHVVNVVSVAGTVAIGPYSASKHAQLAFSRATSASLRTRGIRVHTVNPGFVETEGFPQRSVLRSAFFRRAVLDAEDVAGHIAGLVGEAPRETTIPRWYRWPGVLQALAPNVTARLIARRGGMYRRPG